jgi:LCP family protein required for cell wall assembly
LLRLLEALVLVAVVLAVILFFYSLLGPTDVLIIGVDERLDAGQPSRSDTLIALRASPWQGVSMLSIPRDLWVVIPGHGENRINTACFFGDSGGSDRGAYLARHTIDANLAVPVDYYVRLNFQGFQAVIDALGGIHLDVERAIEDHQYPNDNFGVTSIYIPAGPQWMDGERALQYVRSRHGSGDFARSLRQQQVIVATRERLLSPEGFLRLPLVVAAVSRFVETDLPLPNMALLAFTLAVNGDENIHRHAIDHDSTTSWVTGSGAAVLLPDPARIQPVVHAYLNFYD